MADGAAPAAPGNPRRRDAGTVQRQRWRVVDALPELVADDDEDAQIRKEIAYFQKHGEAGRSKYPTFRGLGWPQGSGAIESSVRRVVNPRLKGNANCWQKRRGSHAPGGSSGGDGSLGRERGHVPPIPATRNGIAAGNGWRGLRGDELLVLATSAQSREAWAWHVLENRG